MGNDGKPTEEQLRTLRLAALEALARGDDELAENLGGTHLLVNDEDS